MVIVPLNFSSSFFEVDIMGERYLGAGRMYGMIACEMLSFLSLSFWNLGLGAVKLQVAEYHLRMS